MRAALTSIACSSLLGTKRNHAARRGCLGLLRAALPVHGRDLDDYGHLELSSQFLPRRMDQVLELREDPCADPMFGLFSYMAITPTHTMHRHTRTQTFLAEAAIAVTDACGPMSSAKRPNDETPDLARRHVS